MEQDARQRRWLPLEKAARLVREAALRRLVLEVEDAERWPTQDAAPVALMRLMQILLPLRDNRGKRLPRALFDKLLEELSEKFGGVTAYTRSPAEGQWMKGARTKNDDIIVVEVMVEKLDAY